MVGSKYEKVKVVHVCSGHLADDLRIFSRECRTLADYGYEVHLIAASENLNYRTEQGVQIHPLPIIFSGSLNRIKRRRKVAQIAADLEPDIYHVHEPELLSPILSICKDRPVIFDVHESYIDIIKEREWIPTPLRTSLAFAWDKFEKRLIKKIYAVITVTEPIAKRYRALHQRVIILANYPDLSNFDPTPYISNRDGKSCVYAGLISKERGMFQVLDAIAILKTKGLEITLNLAGPPNPQSFLTELMNYAKKNNIENQIKYAGNLSKDKVMPFQAQSSIGIIPYLPIPNSLKGLPNKLLECMAAGIPVIFSNFPVYYSVAGKSNAGIAVDPTKPAKIAAAIEKLVRQPIIAEKMGTAGRKAVIEKYNWETQKPDLLELYASIIKPKLSS